MECCLPPPICMAETSAVDVAASLLRNAKQPLLIIGKGSSEWNSKKLALGFQKNANSV